MKVYLTFDDGIHEGTGEVLNILKLLNVSATFFLVGVNINNFFNTNPDLFFKYLNDIYENHTIGNHSFSHGYDQFDVFYQKGILTDTTYCHNIAYEDFLKNAKTINNYLSLLGADIKLSKLPLSKKQKTPLARLPAYDIWRVNIDEIYQSNDFGNKIIFKDRSFATEVANRLYLSGYQVFGWDMEWKMTFDFSCKAQLQKTDFKKNVEKDYLQHSMTYPEPHMCASVNINKDRPIEDWTTMYQKVYTYTGEKLVILMHERAFRTRTVSENNESFYVTDRLPDNDTDSLELYTFIKQLKSDKNIQIHTLDKYNIFV